MKNIVKYLGVNLRKDVKTIQYWWKNWKKTPKKLQDTLCSWVGRIHVAKTLTHPHHRQSARHPPGHPNTAFTELGRQSWDVSRGRLEVRPRVWADLGTAHHRHHRQTQGACRTPLPTLNYGCHDTPPNSTSLLHTKRQSGPKIHIETRTPTILKITSKRKN